MPFYDDRLVTVMWLLVDCVATDTVKNNSKPCTCHQPD